MEIQRRALHTCSFRKVSPEVMMCMKQIMKQEKISRKEAGGGGSEHTSGKERKEENA